MEAIQQKMPKKFRLKGFLFKRYHIINLDFNEWTPTLKNLHGFKNFAKKFYGYAQRDTHLTILNFMRFVCVPIKSGKIHRMVWDILYKKMRENYGKFKFGHGRGPAATKSRTDWRDQACKDEQRKTGHSEAMVQEFRSQEIAKDIPWYIAEP